MCHAVQYRFPVDIRLGQMVGRATTKHYISHPEENNLSIVGVLEQHAPNEFTQGRKIALVCLQFYINGRG